MRDFYGRLVTSASDSAANSPKRYECYFVETDTESIVYTRFFNTGDKPCGIWKETSTKDESGNTIAFKHEYAYAKWEDKLTAKYVPINECWYLQ